MLCTHVVCSIPTYFTSPIRKSSRTAKDAVAYNLALQRLEKSRAVVTELGSHFADMLGPVANEIREFIDSTLGNAEISAHVVNQHWQAFLNELERIRKLSPLLQDLESFAQKVSNAGAPNWAAAIRTQPVIFDRGRQLP